MIPNDYVDGYLNMKNGPMKVELMNRGEKRRCEIVTQL